MIQKKEDLDHKLDGTSPRPIAPPPDIAQVHPKQQEAMKVFEQVQRNRRMGVSINISAIAGQLAEAAPKAVFPEALFVEFFLPLFADEIQPTPELNVVTWIEKVAGGETVAVDIVDTNNNVLFTVPPLFDTSVLEQSKPGGMSMTLVERHYSRLKEVDAMASQTFMYKMLQSMHIKDKPTAEVYTNMKAWDQIFARYGKENKIIKLLNLDNDPNKNNPVGGGGANASANDIADYELDTD